MSSEVNIVCVCMRKVSEPDVSHMGVVRIFTHKCMSVDLAVNIWRQLVQWTFFQHQLGQSRVEPTLQSKINYQVAHPHVLK